MKKDYKNILVVRTDRIGDVVLTTPAIQALKDGYPEARLSILVSPKTRDLVDGNPSLDEVLVDDKTGAHAGFMGFLHLVGLIRKKKFDLAVIYHTKKRTNALCFLAGIPQRIGYKDKKFGRLLTHPLPDTRFKGEKHEKEYCLDVLKALGLEFPGGDMFVPVKEESDLWVEQLLAQNSLLDRRPFIAVHAGASDAFKRWPEENFVDLIDKIEEKYAAEIILFGSPDIRGVSREIRSSVQKHPLDVTGMTTVSQMVSLLKRADLLISNDSGPVHVASAVGTPVISIFTRNQPGINPERWRPLGPRSVVVSSPDEDSAGSPQSGEKETPTWPVIPVETVLEAVEAVMNLREDRKC